MNKSKKVARKPIDLESEFIGKPVSKSVKKLKKNDLTDEFKVFLDKSHITLEDIKMIILRTNGLHSQKYNEKATIKVYAIDCSSLQSNFFNYLIRIKDKNYTHLYLSYFSSFRKLSWFKDDILTHSPLRESVFHKIRVWLEIHPEIMSVLD